MDLKRITTSDLLDEIERRQGVECLTHLHGLNADVVLVVRDLDGLDDTKTYELNPVDGSVELIDQVEVILNLMRDGWRHIDHWRIGDSLMITIRKSERDDTP